MRDGRRELMRNPERYDLITLELPPPSAVGVVNLYSSDFYVLAGAQLQQGGLLAQWLPLPTQNDEDSRSLVQLHQCISHYRSGLLSSTRCCSSTSLNQSNSMRRASLHSSTNVEVAAALHESGSLSRPHCSGRGSRTGPASSLCRWHASSNRRSTADRAGDLGAPKGVLTCPAPIARGSHYAAPPWCRRYILSCGSRRHNRLLRFYDAGLHAYNDEQELWARKMKRVLERE